MSSKFIVASLLVAGIINVLPLMGVLGGAKLQALYGIPFEDNNLLILMRHRAIALALTGAFVLASIFVPAWRTPAMLMVLVSMVAFIALAYLQGGFNASIRKVILADTLPVLLLIPALVLHARDISS